MEHEIVDDGRTNPLIVVHPNQVLSWLRSLADKSGYTDRESCAIQIVVEQPFGEGMKVHCESPKLIFMVSNIPNSRQR